MSQSSPQKNSEARERARKIAEKQSRSNSDSSRRWLQAAVVLVVVLLIAAIAYVYTQNKKSEIPDSGPVPVGANQYGGIVLTKDGITKNSSPEKERSTKDLKTTSNSASPSDGGSATPLPVGMESQKKAAASHDAPRMTIFQDYNCIHCKEFEDAYGKEVEDKVLAGDLTLEIRNLNFLDQETSTEYSSRAAVAAYSVADQVDTKKFLDWEREVFSHQGQGGLSNDELEDISKKYGADVKDALDSNDYRPMVDVTVEESKKNGIQGTPTIYLNSKTVEPDSFGDQLDKDIAAAQKHQKK